MSLLLLTIAILASQGLAQLINPDQIAKIVYLNDTSFVSYNSSSSKCRIDCAEGEVMAQPNFRSFQKVWMLNNTEMFSADDKTFIDSNRSLEFQVLTPEDSGVYQCCIRSVDMAYQSFVCYSTQLTVLDEMPSDMEAMNSTEPPMPPSWNVVVNDGDVLKCLPENNYFLKIFEDNVTDIKCLVNEVNAKISTNNKYPEPLYNDLFIHEFNVTDHSGVYVCNGTMQISSNETLIETVTFTVSQSGEQNPSAILLEDGLVREAIKNYEQHLLTTSSAVLQLVVIALAVFQMF